MSSKSEVLVIGCGGCGNALLDELMSLDRRYTGVFMNTNMNEMKDKKFFDKVRRCFYIPNADGTGKNRLLAEQYIKEDGAKFAEMIKKFEGQNHVIFLTSGNGGTGSKASTLYPPLIKKLCPDKTVTIIATFPNISESDIDFENARDFWNELITLKNKGIVDNVQLIDNNKDLSEIEINQLSMKMFNNSFDIMNGKIDTTDLSKYHKCKGYSIYLELHRNELINSTKNTIENAIKNSVFYTPNSLECDVLVADVNINDFSIDEIRSKIQAYDFIKINQKTEGVTKLCVGGCKMPTDAIDLVMEALKELENKKKSRILQEDLIVSGNNKYNQDKIKSSNSGTRLTSEDLDKLFEDDDFWS